MQVKKGLLGFLLILTTVILVGCGQEAPDLSFEETIKAYNLQNQEIRSALQLLTSPEGIISSSLQASIKGELDKGEEGNLAITSNSVSEISTKNQKSDLNLSLDINSAESLMGTAVNATAKLGAEFIMKDYIPYFQLKNLEIKGNKTIEEQLSFFTAMTEGFKGKWLTLSGMNLDQVISQLQTTPTLSGEIMEDKVEYYTGITKTEYNGQPAWKVEFNTDIIKNDIKKIIEQSFQTQSGSLGSSLAISNAQTLEQFNQTIDSMKIENLEAYFVIYAQNNIKFVIKQGDIIVTDWTSTEMKIHIQQAVEAKKYEGQFSIIPNLTGEEKNEISEILVHYNIQEQGKGQYSFSLDVNSPEKKMLTLTGKLAFIVEKDTLSIKPNITLTVDTIKISTNGEYSIKKINDYTFTAPNDAEDLWNLLWGFFGTDPEIEELSGVNLTE